MSTTNNKTVGELRAAGHAVVTYAPDELYGHTPESIENVIKELAADVLKVLAANPRTDESKKTPDDREKPQGRPCYLYTLDGTFEAVAGEPHLDWSCRAMVVTIKTVDGIWQRDVYQSVVDDRFENTEVPTFYAC